MDTRKAVKTYHRNLAIVLAIIVAIFAAIPLVVDKPYIINIFVLTFYMSTLSMAWNILGGITGQNSLGLAAYMGLGTFFRHCTNAALYPGHVVICCPVPFYSQSPFRMDSGTDGQNQHCSLTCTSQVCYNFHRFRYEAGCADRSPCSPS